MLVEATCAVAFQKGELHHAHMRQSTDELLAASGFVDCTCCSCLWRRQDYLKKNPAGMRQLSIHRRQQQKANRKLGTHIKLTCSSPRCNWCCICVGFWTSACMTSRRAYRDPEHDSVVSSSFINAILVRYKPDSWLMRPVAGVTEKHCLKLLTRKVVDNSAGNSDPWTLSADFRWAKLSQVHGNHWFEQRILVAFCE